MQDMAHHTFRRYSAVILRLSLGMAFASVKIRPSKNHNYIHKGSC